MTSITSLGTGSGLDLEGIVTKLMAVESQPLTDLTNKASGLQTKLSAYGTLQSTLSALQITAKALTTNTTFTAASTSLSDSSVMSVSADSGAAIGSYAINVNQLAQAQTLRSNTDYAATTDTFNTGSIAISVGGKDATTITIDSSNNTLAGIRDAINAASAGVTASIVNDGTTNRLLLSSNTTGFSAGAFTVAATDSGSGGTNALSGLDSTNLVQTQAPLDAKFSINGLAISRASNTVTDAIKNVSFTLSKAGTLTTPVTTQLVVSKDTASIQASISNFVSAYNSAVTQIKSLSAYDATTNTASVLTGDSTLRNIGAQLSATIFGSVTGLSGGISMLSNIGISVQKDGTLTTDGTKLKAALASGGDVAGLFSATTTGNTGIGVRMNSLIDSLIGTGGIIASRTSGITQSIKDLSDQHDALTVRLTKIEADYRARFTLLDTTVSSMQGTASYLTQQLAYLKTLATGSLRINPTFLTGA